MNRPVQSTKPTSDSRIAPIDCSTAAISSKADDAFERPQQRPRGGRALGRRLHFRPQLAGGAEMPAAERVLNEPEHHADAGGAEAKMPVDRLPQVSAHQRSEKSAEVDAHVIDRESRVAPRAAFGIQIADDRADVGLQQAGADDDEREADVERDDVRNGEREVADRNDGAAPEHRAAQAEQPVRDPSARQRDDIHGRGVEAVNRGRRHVVQAHAAGGDGVGHEQHENGAHAVVAEALPHLGEEERRQPARMPEPVCRQSSKRSIMMGCAPSHSVNRPRSARCSAPDTIVRK